MFDVFFFLCVCCLLGGWCVFFSSSKAINTLLSQLNQQNIDACNRQLHNVYVDADDPREYFLRHFGIIVYHQDTYYQTSRSIRFCFACMINLTPSHCFAHAHAPHKQRDFQLHYLFFIVLCSLLFIVYLSTCFVNIEQKNSACFSAFFSSFSSPLHGFDFMVSILVSATEINYYLH